MSRYPEQEVAANVIAIIDLIENKYPDPTERDDIVIQASLMNALVALALAKADMAGISREKARLGLHKVFDAFWSRTANRIDLKTVKAIRAKHQ